MTFRGIELKPGKSIQLDCKDIGGKFVLTQATLGNGTSTEETTLLCNFEGDEYTIHTFLPEKSECCFMNIIFFEEELVRFTVDGPTSIHLTGYIKEAPQDLDDKGYGHDARGEHITCSESEESDYNSEESFDYNFTAGVEVKPGKPLTIDCGKLGGKLMLTKAILGKGSSLKKSILQCEVGDESPVFLCTLLPEKSESCALFLDFDEEDDDVKLSAVGPNSIHLFGFVHKCFPDFVDKGTESEESDDNSEEFSDDDLFHDYDVTMYPPSTVPNSGVVVEERAVDEKASGESGSSKQWKKKKSKLADIKNDQKGLVVKENNGASVLDSEDEDGFPYSEKSEPNSENGDIKTKYGKCKKNKTKTDSKDDVVDDISGNFDVDRSEEPKSDKLANKKKRKKKEKRKIKTDKTKRKKKQKSKTKTKTDNSDDDDDTKKVVPEVMKTDNIGELVEKGRSYLLVHALGKPNKLFFKGSWSRSRLV